MTYNSKWFFITIFFIIIFFIYWFYSETKTSVLIEPDFSSTNNNKSILEKKIVTTNRDSIIIENQILEHIKSDLNTYFDKYVIQEWDTMTSISNTYGISDYRDLILLNSLLWVEFKYLNDEIISVVLQKWYKMFVPKYGTIWIINSKLTDLRKIKYTLEINNKINLANNLDLSYLTNKLYPNTVRGLWIEKILQWFIEAQKYEFDPYLPRIVDVKWQNTISCSNLIRTLLAYSVDKEKLTDDEKLFFQVQWLDAWILPIALQKIGYVQKFNLMNNFSEYLVGTPNPIPKEGQDNYDKGVLELWKYLEINWTPWSIVPFYFRYSDYTKVIAKYNKNKEEKHYNTHQSVLAWIDTISFDARNVWIVAEWRIKSFEESWLKEINIFDYLVNFVQQRWDYWVWALMTWTKKSVRTNLLKFQSLLHIKVNWVSIDLSQEFKKDNDKMFKIKPDDKIEIYWPIMIDWLHMLSSPDESRRKNMNARTRFYFELISIWNFLPSEMLEPKKNTLWIWVKTDDLISELTLKWVYSIKAWYTIESAIMEKIPVYEKEKFNSLDKSDLNYVSNYKKLLNYYYSQQIKALKITWYMQSENDINSGSFNINAPIPYFDTKNISDIFERYVSYMNKKSVEWNSDIYSIKNFIQITTFPLDTYKTLLNRIKDELMYHSNYSNSLEHIGLLSDFNELQQRKFLDKFLSKSEKTKNFVSKDILNWKISEGITIILGLKEIDKIIYDISEESYSVNLKLREVDEYSINLVLNIKQNKNIIENILYMESYIPEGSYWIRRLLKQFLENNSLFQQTFNIFWIKFSTRISSYWDFQLRLSNLYKWLNEEGLDKNQLLKAFSYLEDKRLYDYVLWLDNISKRKITQDLEIVDKINSLLLEYENIDEETKEKYREKIISGLQKILILDDWNGRNIVWKIIWVSLLNDKLNLHFQKLNWILQASGDNLANIYENKEAMESYEKLIILINNLWELNVVYWLAENYLIRNIDLISNKLWKKYSYPELETTSTLWHFVYWRNTFIEHLSLYNIILTNLKKDLDKTYDKTTKEYRNIDSMISYLEQDINKFFNSDNNNVVENIYELFTNKKIKILSVILNNWKDTNLITSILPLKSEFDWNWFRDIFFRYINTRDIKRNWPWVISKIVTLIR